MIKLKVKLNIFTNKLFIVMVFSKKQISLKRYDICITQICLLAVQNLKTDLLLTGYFRVQEFSCFIIVSKAN